MTSSDDLLRALRHPAFAKVKPPRDPHAAAGGKPPATVRLVTERQGAEEVLGIPLATFRAWVKSGRLPQPLPEVNLWDVRALNAAVDRISGLGAPTNALDTWRAKGGHGARRA